MTGGADIRPTPAARIRGLKPYKPSAGSRPDALRLHANEGRAPDLDVGAALAGLDLARYPSAAALEARLAERHGIDADRVVVTAGADDALARIALAVLEPGRAAAIFAPTFEMIPRYVRLAGAEAVEVSWLDAPFPEDGFAEALGRPGVTAGFVVTPSSPAGEVAPADAVLRLADLARARGQLLVVDLAYVEFAEHDPTAELVARGDVLVTRTLSKALGLAGLRVGYAIGPAPVADWLRAVGQPFAVSAPSLALAERALEDAEDRIAAARDRVREERRQLHDRLLARGAQPVRSEANFVLARLGERGRATADALEASGYRVRLLAGPGLEGALRITCPQDPAAFEGLLAALDRALDREEARP